MTGTTEKRPRVGVGVVVIKQGRVLLGKRKGSHGEGDWALPGGHLDFGETLEECAHREVTKEETGVAIKNIRYLSFTNDIFDTEKHYATLYLIAEWESGEPQVLEPNKCEEWGWFEWDDLPQPLFLPLQHLIEQDIYYLMKRLA